MKRKCVSILVPLFCAALWLHGQSATTTTPEVTTQEAPVAFKSGVNLVLVPVVVRDSKGHAVDNLVVDDFRLLDNGKPQMISKFTVEKFAATTSAATGPQEGSASGEPAAASQAGMPDRFVAYLFDDLHMTLADLTYTRNAARRQIDSALHATERAAVFTTSGRVMTDFTDDKEKLHTALDAIDPAPTAAIEALQKVACPPVTYYEADLIVNRDDSNALDVAALDAIVCAHIDPPNMEEGRARARLSAVNALKQGDRDAVASLDTLLTVIGKVAAAPGQRTIVLVSPGFLVLSNVLTEETQLIERALKAGIVIGALDARGLYAMSAAGEAGDRTLSLSAVTPKFRHNADEATAQADVMANLAAGTGGTFYKGKNDYDEGFARVATAPEVLYVLGFNPSELKLDGRFHDLKITLRNPAGFTVQSRTGYYAPSYGTDPAEQAKQQIEEAFFSREEMSSLPVVLQADYFRAPNGEATLSAVARIDVKKLAFRKEADRNQDDVTVVTGIFDSDGNYVSGVQKVVKLRLTDDSLQKRFASGIGVKSSFAVHPGRYLIRLVVRDSQGQLMSAQSSQIEIPQ